MNTVRVVLGMFPQFKKIIAHYAQWQRELLPVMTLLPGHYTTEHIEAALQVSDMTPNEAYRTLASGQYHPKLAHFYEALGVSNAPS